MRGSGKNIWAVVPVRRLGEAKTRLATVLTQPQRVRLVLTMLEGVLDALVRVPELTGTIVVSPDPSVRAFAASKGVEGLDEPGIGGLNGAVERGRKAVLERGADGLLVVPGDLPLMTAGAVSRLFDCLPGENGIVVVPSHDGGTNALLLVPPDAIAPCFGEASSRHHVDSALEKGLSLAVCNSPSLEFDVDRPRDVAKLVELSQREVPYDFLGDDRGEDRHATPVRQLLCNGPRGAGWRK